MTKMLLLIASSLVMAICSSAFPASHHQQINGKYLETIVLNNTIDLDPEGTFRLNWDLVYEIPTNPLVVLEIRVQTSGWFSLRFTSTDLTLGDYFYGAYDPNKPSDNFILDKHCQLFEGIGCETPEGPREDIRNDFQLVSLEFKSGYSMMRIARLADTGNNLQDVVMTPGSMMIGWAWSSGIYNEFGLLTLIEKNWIPKCHPHRMKMEKAIKESIHHPCIP